MLIYDDTVVYLMTFNPERFHICKECGSEYEGCQVFEGMVRVLTVCSDDCYIAYYGEDGIQEKDVDLYNMRTR